MIQLSLCHLESAVATHSGYNKFSASRDHIHLYVGVEYNSIKGMICIASSMALIVLVHCIIYIKYQIL